jgi:hypothetical protein
MGDWISMWGRKCGGFLQFYGSPIAPTLEGTRFTARLLVRIILSLGHQHAKVPQVLALLRCGGRSGASSRTFNQEIFEKEFAFAGVERTAAAKACHITLGRWPWQGFKSDNFLLCRADGAMEQRCYRFHTHPRICDPV